MTSCREIVTSLRFFQFTANLEQSGSQIPDAYSVKLMFSLQKLKTELKIIKHSSHTIALSKGTIFAKKR